MAKFKVAFFDTKPYDREFFEKENSHFNFDIKFFNNHLNSDTAVLTKGFDAVCAFVNDDLSKKVVDSLFTNGVKLIAMRCAGYNNVDLRAVYGKIHVVRVPTYSPYAVAEHTVALILALNRKTHRAYYRIRDYNFTISGLLGFDMHGKTIGVIGTGQIGKVLVRIMKGFGMQVLAYDLLPDKKFSAEMGLEYVDLNQLYRESDIISLHCPLTPENLHMIDKGAISKMKDGVTIINTGRGKLINTKDLIAGLKSGKISAAGLDVYEEETDYFFEDFSSNVIDDDVLARLLTFPNVLITSHQGFFTKEALQNITKITLTNIYDFLKSGKSKNEICYKCGNHECMKEKQGKCF
jgi:D-lactate dehydrogenase